MLGTPAWTSSPIWPNPLPAIVISELLGLPVEDREQVKRWSDDLAIVFEQDTSRPDRYARATHGVHALLEYMATRVASYRTTPRDDLMGALVSASEGGEVLSPAEVVANSTFLLFAGHETTTNLIGNGLLALVRHPLELRRLRANPALLVSSVEECLRYDSPVQQTARTAVQEVEIAGARIRGGQPVLLLLGAANHDPARFPDPQRFDIGRTDNRHVAFSHGIHSVKTPTLASARSTRRSEGAWLWVAAARSSQPIGPAAR